MGQEQQRSWLDLREEEYKEGEKKEEQLVNTLAVLDRRIKGIQEEQKYWGEYIAWVKQNKEKMEDAEATLWMCEQIKEEAVEHEKEVTEAFDKTKLELDRIRCLRSFVRWVSQRL